ncbi:MAG: signal peptidase [Acidobacteriaceae bacterium]|nr:signal peptidase [Acidobacteriaceae bacterium]
MQYANSQTTFRRYYFFIAVIVLMLDQATKSLVARNLPLHDTITVIPGFFSISHVLNPGAAFSLFADSASRYTTAGLIFFSVVVLSVVSTLLWRSGHAFTAGGLALALIMGGALGNLLDRIRLGSVIDFLMFNIGSYHWPDFNIADSAIVLGSLLLISDLFFHQEAAETRS